MSAFADDCHFRGWICRDHGFLFTVIVTALFGLISGIFTSLGIQWLTPALFG